MNPNLVAISGADRVIRQTEPILNRVGGPKALVGRMMGLGQAEIRAGIPGWAWIGVGFLAGAAVMYRYRRQAERLFDED